MLAMWITVALENLTVAQLTPKIFPPPFTQGEGSLAWSIS